MGGGRKGKGKRGNKRMREKSAVKTEGWIEGRSVREKEDYRRTKDVE